MPASYSQELTDRARRLCETHGPIATAAILRIHRCAVHRMRERGWKQGRPGRQRPMPTDFAIQQRHMTHEQLRAHYRTASSTVTRWRKEVRG